MEAVNSAITIHYIKIFGIQISETLLISWIVVLILIVFATIFRFLIFPRFKENPKGFQNFIEMIVEAAHKFAVNRIGSKFGMNAGAYVLTIGALLITASLAELIGFKPPMANLTFTASLALISFILINYYGIRKKGLWGRLKSFGQPKAFIAPVRVLVDFALPVSLACRLFGNVLGGLVVMDLLYAVIQNYAFIYPAVFAIYFNLFHILIQTYIFLNLTFTFAGEAME